MIQNGAFAIRFVDGKAGGTLETADLVSSLGPLAQEFHQALVEFVNFLTPVGDVHEIQVSGLRSQVSGLRSQVSGLRSQVSEMLGPRQRLQQDSCTVTTQKLISALTLPG